MPFPTYDDAVDVAQLQAAVNEAISQHTKSGESSGTIPVGESFVNVQVSFGTPFATTPRVSPVPRTSDAYRATVISKSASATTIRLFRPSGASTSGSATVPFDWIATDLPNS